MYYTIYKTTNKLDGKFYIGKHQTVSLNDSYIGSGKRLHRAVNKHGIENFVKEILFVFETEQEMNDKEKEIVTPEFLKRKDVYNLCEGGKGGWGYINTNGINLTEKHKTSAKINLSLGNKKLKELSRDTVWRHELNSKISNSLKNRFTEIPHNWLGKKHKDSTKKKISESTSKSQRGNKNSQFGTCWVSDGHKNKKIKKEELYIWLDKGFYKGRTIQPKSGL